MNSKYRKRQNFQGSYIFAVDTKQEVLQTALIIL